MYKVPDGIQYTKTHEWFKLDGDVATIGITDYAQHQLTDVVYIELPKVGDTRKAGSVLLTVESVKSAEEVYSPVSGTVVAVNNELETKPELINKDSYANWMAKIKVSEKAQGISAEEYRKLTGE